MKSINNEIKLIWDVKLGYLCNNDCLFCIYPSEFKASSSMRMTDEVKHELEKGIRQSMQKALFVGGEPTIHPDIIEIVRHAYDVGFKEIEIMTNGRMFSDKNFTEQICNAGLTNSTVSIHSHNAGVADYLSQRVGSFEETVQGIKNLLSHGIYLVTSTVIVHQNYRFLPEIVNFLADLGVSNVELRFVRTDGNTYRNFYLICPTLTEVSPFVCDAIDVGKERGLEMRMDEYPLCFVRNHEEYFSETPCSINIRDITGENTKKDGREIDAKCKGPQCSMCKYNNVCLGIRKTYLKFRPNGLYELHPVCDV